MAFVLKRQRIFRNSFRYPVGDPPRTAVLADWFHSPRFRFDRKNPVRVFTNAREAAQFAPEALAATHEQLLSTNPATLPSLTRAVIALARPGERLLTAAERDRLWRAFRIPVFEQIIGEREIRSFIISLKRGNAVLQTSATGMFTELSC